MNLSSTGYPMLSCRKKRGLMQSLDSPQGLLAKESLAWIDGGRLYYAGEETPLTVSSGEKQMVSM